MRYSALKIALGLLTLSSVFGVSTAFAEKTTTPQIECKGMTKLGTISVRLIQAEDGSWYFDLGIWPGSYRISGGFNKSTDPNILSINSYWSLERLKTFGQAGKAEYNYLTHTMTFSYTDPLWTSSNGTQTLTDCVESIVPLPEYCERQLVNRIYGPPDN